MRDGLARPLSHGRWWAQASERIEALTDDEIEAARNLFHPLLPDRMQEIVDYNEVPQLRV